MAAAFGSTAYRVLGIEIGLAGGILRGTETKSMLLC